MRFEHINISVIELNTELFHMKHYKCCSDLFLLLDKSIEPTPPSSCEPHPCSSNMFQPMSSSAEFQRDPSNPWVVPFLGQDHGHGVCFPRHSWRRGSHPLIPSHLHRQARAFTQALGRAPNRRAGVTRGPAPMGGGCRVDRSLTLSSGPMMEFFHGLG